MLENHTTERVRHLLNAFYRHSQEKWLIEPLVANRNYQVLSALLPPDPSKPKEGLALSLLRSADSELKTYNIGVCLSIQTIPLNQCSKSSLSTNVLYSVSPSFHQLWYSSLVLPNDHKSDTKFCSRKLRTITRQILLLPLFQHHIAKCES